MMVVSIHTILIVIATMNTVTILMNFLSMLLSLPVF